MPFSVEITRLLIDEDAVGRRRSRRIPDAGSGLERIRLLSCSSVARLAVAFRSPA